MRAWRMWQALAPQQLLPSTSLFPLGQSKLASHPGRVRATHHQSLSADAGTGLPSLQSSNLSTQVRQKLAAVGRSLLCDCAAVMAPSSTDLLVSSLHEQRQDDTPVTGHLPLQHSTQLLHIDPSTLPAVLAPDAATVRSTLTSATAPSLDRSSCRHLYYSLPPQQQHLAACSSQDALQEAAALLRLGEPVAIPTETVYGLAADALSATAVSAVFAAKGRPSDNPLIVHISDLDMLAQLYPQQQQDTEVPQQHASSSSSSSGQTSFEVSPQSLDFIPQQYRRLIAAFWPGPLTLLLPASPSIPAAVTAGLSTVAVRMPAHPVARALIAAAGVPLAAPSANTSGRPSPTTAQHVLQDMNGRIAAVVDGGPCACGVESTVLDGLRCPPVVLRPGGITPELLGVCPDMQGLQVYQRDFTDKQLEDAPTTPGMKYRHYSPHAPLLLLDPTTAWQQQQQQQQGGAQSQQSHWDGLQQAMTEATQQLLQNLLQQQQAPQLGQPEALAACRRVVLLSTCNSGSSHAGQQDSRVGWTASSLQGFSDHLHQPQLQPQPGSPVQRADGSSSGGSSIEVLEYVLGSWQQPELVAQQLFAALRAADAVTPHLIIAQGLPPEGPALAVMNRLHKAASTHVQVQQV